jgi:hypothetical protein
MTNTQGDPQAAQLLKLLHEFKSSSISIDIGLFMTLLRMWELIMGMPTGSDERTDEKRPGCFTMKMPCLICPHPAVSGKTKNCSHPPPTVLP